jgi:hypothetical protein
MATVVTFDPGELKELQEILSSARERQTFAPVQQRYDLAYTMNRWAHLALNCLHPTNADKPPLAPIENENELLAKIAPGARRQYRKKRPPMRKRRPRVDYERDLALALAVIYHEYTNAKPTRISKNYEAVHNTYDRDKTSPFYRFATVAFNTIGLKPKEVTFREATERWEESKDLNKENFQLLIWGQLPHDGNEGRLLTWREKPLRPRIKPAPD